MADVLRHRHLLAAVRADPPTEALGQRALQHGGQEVGFDAHVDESADRADRVIGVQGGEDQVTGQSRAHGDLRCFAVADLSDEDDVRVLSQDVPQSRGEGQTALGIHGDLVDAGELVLDRVLDGNDLLAWVVELAEGGVERGRFARTGRTRHQHQPVRLGDEGVDHVAKRLVHAQRLEIKTQGALVEDSHHDRLAVQRGYR